MMAPSPAIALSTSLALTLPWRRRRVSTALYAFLILAGAGWLIHALTVAPHDGDFLHHRLVHQPSPHPALAPTQPLDGAICLSDPRRGRVAETCRDLPARPRRQE